MYTYLDEFDKIHRDEASPDNIVGEQRRNTRVSDPLCSVFFIQILS